MQKWLIAGITIMLCVPFRMSAQDSYQDRVNKYVHDYCKLAEEEQLRSGIPASVTLGQGVLETQAGTSELMTKANNHFGIKCKKEWQGETFAHTDDAPNECFRKYKCAEDSYKDHSDYLKKSPRYAALFKLSQTDYAAWAYGLKRCGYATNPHYAQQLIKIIEDFHLQQYTYAAINNHDVAHDDYVANEQKTKPTVEESAVANEQSADEVVTKPVVAAPQSIQAKPVQSQYVAGKEMKINGLRAIYAFKGETLLQYAIKYNIRYQHLLDINDLQDGPLPANMYIYLEKKNYRGTHEAHLVKPGETLQQIAQLEGIQLRRLMMLNHLTMVGEEPEPGTILQLQKMADAKPRMSYADYARTTAKNNAPAQQPVSTYIDKTAMASATPVAEQPQVASQTAAGNQKPLAAYVQHGDKIEKVEYLPVQKAQSMAPANTELQSNTSIKPVSVEQEVAEQPKQEEPVKQDVESTTTKESSSILQDADATTQQVAKEEIKSETANNVQVENPVQPAVATTTPAVTEEKKPVPAQSPMQEQKNIAEPVKNGEYITRTQVIEVQKTAPADKEQAPVSEIKTAPATMVASNASAATSSETKEVKHADVADEDASHEETPAKQQEPMDELDALKAKLDKVVYATDNKTTATAPAPVKEPVTTPVIDKQAAQLTAQDTKDVAKFYTVKRGDTAFSIAKRNNITMRELMEWNNLDFDAVKIGQRLRVKK